jgi:formiminotetrahydrofolate cyclodeaminase
MSSLFGFIAGASPTGIVSIAAASASLALRVLHGVLEIAASKQSSETIAELLDSSAREAHNLARLAQEDGQVYAVYVQARRERSPNVQIALQRAIETPMAAARSAAAGIDLCRQALPFSQGAIAADVGGAAVVLAGAVRAILGCVEANLAAVEDSAFARLVHAETGSLEERVVSESQRVAEVARGRLRPSLFITE